jgi:hypothetical protein
MYGPQWKDSDVTFLIVVFYIGVIASLLVALGVVGFVGYLLYLGALSLLA